MESPHVAVEDDIRTLLSKLQNIDITQIEADESAKIRVLSLIRKITANLEGPINRATDLVFRVRFSPIL